MRKDVEAAIEAHRAAGRRFEAGGVGSFVREQGFGDAVVMLHGVPTSSYLYRKMLPPLAERGLRGVAFDFPGLGLADRPQDYDYTWGGLARFTGEAIDELGVERCHLVVHDIGGPIGFEWAIANPDRLISMTVLNTIIDAASFRRPWPMHPFSIEGVGEVYLGTMTPIAMAELFYMQGIADRSATPRAEVYAYYHLLKREDRGRAFLKIMRGFELTEAKQRLFHEGLAPGDRPYPAQAVWGAKDPALGEARLAEVQRAMGIDDPLLLPAKHFLQEDQAPAIANAVAGLAERSG